MIALIGQASVTYPSWEPGSGVKAKIIQGLRIEMGGFSQGNQGRVFKGRRIVLQGGENHSGLLLNPRDPPILADSPALVPSSRSPTI